MAHHSLTLKIELIKKKIPLNERNLLINWGHLPELSKSRIGLCRDGFGILVLTITVSHGRH